MLSFLLEFKILKNVPEIKYLSLLCILSIMLFSGATVYMVCRSKERGEAALSQIQSTTGNKKVHLEV